jgi:anaerobic ribonucleoside-triphosphate reductase activating protein
VLWLQGCPRQCPGCINPEFLPIGPRHSIAVERMAERILAVTGIEGVTYSGGEPFLQAAPLAALSARLQAQGLGVVCYSGYRLQELQELQGHPDPGVRSLLARLDLLIDGPFIQTQAVPLLWRGSANQELHFLSPRYAADAHSPTMPAAAVELSLGSGGLAATGFWPEMLLRRLQEVLEH